MTKKHFVKYLSTSLVPSTQHITVNGRYQKSYPFWTIKKTLLCYYYHCGRVGETVFLLMVDMDAECCHHDHLPKVGIGSLLSALAGPGARCGGRSLVPVPTRGR